MTAPAPADAAPPGAAWFWLFCGAHVCVWTLLPAFVLANLPLDTIEGLAWGRQAELGYYNHPPMWPWLLGATRSPAGDRDWAIYLLGQLTVVTTFFCVWRLARAVVSAGEALRAVLLLEGVYYLGYHTVEYNSNLVLTAAWAAAAWAFHRALRTGRPAAWLGLGLAAGLAIYCKYSIAVLFLCFGIYLVGCADGRRALRTAGPYAAVAVALVVAAPHLWWLVESGYLPLHYALDRAAAIRAPAGPAGTAVTFLGALFLAVAPLVGIVLVAAGRPPADAPAAAGIADADRRLVLALTVGPLAVCAVLGLFVRLSTLWAAPMLSLAGLAAVVLRLGSWRPRRFRWAWSGVCAFWIVLFVVVRLGGPLFTGRAHRTHFPGRELAAEVQRAWHARAGRPLTLVHGETWLAGNVVAYAPDRPAALVANDYVLGAPLQRINPWVTDGMLACGAVLVWTPERPLRPEAAQLFPHAERQPSLRLAWQSWLPIRPVVIHTAIAPPDPARCPPASSGAAG